MGRPGDYDEDDVHSVDSFEDVDLGSTTFLAEIAQIRRQVDDINDLVENDDRLRQMQEFGAFSDLQLQLDEIEKSARAREEGLHAHEGEGEGGGDDDDEDEPDMIAFDEDTYSIMILAPALSLHWSIGIVAMFFQYLSLILILLDLVAASEDGSALSIPYNVPIEVTVGQFMGIFICVGAQSDVLSSVRLLIALMHTEGSAWDEVIGLNKDKRTWKVWAIQIYFPLIFKFISGVLILIVNFITIVQSSNIVDLTKDVGALMIISEIPEIFFNIARFGFLGNGFYDITLKVEETEVESSYDFGKFVFGVYIPARVVVFFAILLMMFTAVAILLEGQISGRYFFDTYPYCKIDVNEIPQIGNGKCQGGIFNTIACGFDGGDCIEFNIQYPNCKAPDPFKVGDDNCDELYNNLECNFDGNDCCPFNTLNFTDPRYGDGMCDGGKFFAGLCNVDGNDCRLLTFQAPRCDYEALSDLVPFGEEPRLGDKKCESQVYNTPECLFENGDCVECNEKVFDYRLTGDGVCHGGPHNTDVCNNDAGDCESFNKRWPRCKEKMRRKFDDRIAIVPIIGDGICNSGLYNNEDCGYEDGDCLFCNELVPNITKIGDGFCDGQQYMSEVCGFDGGDCLGCNALRFEIGNGWCTPAYNTPECSFDGGDCAIMQELTECNVEYPSLLSNGECNGGEYNTEACEWDGGDCLEVKLEGCDVPERRHFLLGDGYCDAFMNTPECDFDGGDCVEFNEKYPDCMFDGLLPGLIGDGSCDGGQYNTEACGWDGGDCVFEL